MPEPTDQHPEQPTPAQSTSTQPRRVFFTADGPAHVGTVLEEDHLLPDGTSHPDGDLFLCVAFDDGTDWFHHSFVTELDKPVSA